MSLALNARVLVKFKHLDRIMEGMEGVEFAEQPQAMGGEGVLQFDANGLEVDVDQANQAPIQPVADAPAQRLTSRFLSKYERARLLGVRSKQIR
jgi:hypothetical protein